MRQNKNVFIFYILIFLLISFVSESLYIILNIVAGPRHILSSDSLKALTFYFILIFAGLLILSSLYLYAKSLRSRLVTSNKRLLGLFKELNKSQNTLKTQLIELEDNEARLKRSEERYRFVINTMKVGIWDFDVTTGVTYIAQQLYLMFGFNEEDFADYPKKWYRKIHPQDRLNTFRFFKEKLKDKEENIEYQFRHITKYGEYRWVQAVARAQWDKNGRLLRLAGSLTDINEKRENEEKIKHMAFYDSLTGLPNRAYLHEYVNNVIKRGKMAAFIFIDIDNFKYVNDSLGHSQGDFVIIEMCRRISGLITNGIVARWGGDEIIVLLENIANKDDICELTGEMIDKVYLSFGTRGITVNLSISAGVAVFPEHGTDFETLLKNADTAMYSAKDSGKNKYCLFDASMNDALYQKMKFEGLLSEAIEKNELQLYLQPQYDMKKGTLCGVEALVRWHNDSLGEVSPSEFIPVAEASGLIIPLGLWVFRQACKFQLQLMNFGYNNITVSINISALQFNQEDFIENIKSYIADSKVNPQMLEFEITESVLLDSKDETITKLKELQKIGIKIALDDFGKGYSSLTYLRLFPIDILKMDRGFIENIATNKTDQEISGLIVNVAHSLGLRVVAEGVETSEQRDVLLNFGCDIAQGYLYSEPIKDTDFFNTFKKLL